MQSGHLLRSGGRFEGGDRAAAGDKNLEIFDAATARPCLDAGPIDEIVVHVAPVLLGDGVRLYAAPGAKRVLLQRVNDSAQVVDLHCTVKQDARG